MLFLFDHLIASFLIKVRAASRTLLVHSTISRRGLSAQTARNYLSFLTGPAFLTLCFNRLCLRREKIECWILRDSDRISPGPPYGNDQFQIANLQLVARQ